MTHGSPALSYRIPTAIIGFVGTGFDKRQDVSYTILSLVKGVYDAFLVLGYCTRGRCRLSIGELSARCSGRRVERVRGVAMTSLVYCQEYARIVVLAFLAYLAIC